MVIITTKAYYSIYRKTHNKVGVFWILRFFLETICGGTEKKQVYHRKILQKNLIYLLST